jgi:4-hydroxythreonine-4-phosphate dehydrogenase
VVAVSMGDPLGIGAEILVKALADQGLRSRARFVVFGWGEAMHRAAGAAGIAPFWQRGAYEAGAEGPRIPAECLREEVVVLEAGGAGLDASLLEGAARPTGVGGLASFRWVEDALACAMLKRDDPRAASAMVTAPIAKEAWNMAGGEAGRFPGHTELLAARCGSARCAMLFVGPVLVVSLATVHVPLASVPRLLSIDRVFDAIELTHQACVEMGRAGAGEAGRPRIAVCGLNPHAGEHGLMGDEEQRVVSPAIERAVGAGIDAVGPLPGDSVFLAAAKRKFDAVVAMYHDQGLIPVKLLDREKTVNTTVGLRSAHGKVVRTSPAHGTAFDIAGKNLADAASMRAAIELAIEIAGRAGRA